MKWMIASDIHGSSGCCEAMIRRYREEKADRLVLLGDLLYHGPRNDLPEDYDPRRTAELLNGISRELLCIRGNCDSEVDQMMLEFPILAKFAVLDFGQAAAYATHGHVYNPDALPPLRSGDLLLYGHTHVPGCTERGGILCLNPGSVSIPKGNSRRSYMTYENGVFRWKTTEGEETGVRRL